MVSMTNRPFRGVVHDYAEFTREYRRHRFTQKHARLFGLTVTGFLGDDGWRVYYKCWHTGKLTHYTFATFADGLRCILDNMQFIPN